ncbi:MAG: response regulator, partial [Gloeomargaritaceae cyanobacterium C42_A2020_066]|nr:response regulator [Gloeomargaritaceae cyanobacterium C42_A2020_066]
VRTAINGQEALDRWEDWEPHLIWMDMRMPVMDGFTATRRIKATDRGQATVVIALSGSVFEQERLAVSEAGCDDFVFKPFKEAILFDKMAQYLGVTYRYETEASSAAAPVADAQDLPATALADAPPDWLTQLHSAALRVNQKRVLELITTAPSLNPEVTAGLTHLAQHLRFDKIVALAAPYLADS